VTTPAHTTTQNSTIEIMANDLQKTPTDEAPTSPLERQQSLEKHLQTRPDAQDLKNRNILLDTNAAPSLQAAALELERQRATNSLRKGLERRPDREELVERNILSSTTAAPALQAQRKELERHMRKDSLDKKLQNRPKAEELIKGGILETDEGSVVG